jgi:uncharacterized membrane protein YjgN (DUF898 family)
MNYRVVLVLAGLVSAVAWVQFFRLVNTTEPTTLTITLAMVLLFFAVGGIGTLLSWLVLRRLRYQRTRTALRHGVWIGLTTVLCGVLLLADTLSWLVALVVLALFITAESLFVLSDLGL